MLNAIYDQSFVLQRAFTDEYSRLWDVGLRALLFSQDSSLLYSLSSDLLLVTRVDTGDDHIAIHVGERAQLALLPNSNDIILIY